MWVCRNGHRQWQGQWRRAGAPDDVLGGGCFLCEGRGSACIHKKSCATKTCCLPPLSAASLLPLLHPSLTISSSLTTSSWISGSSIDARATRLLKRCWPAAVCCHACMSCSRECIHGYVVMCCGETDKEPAHNRCFAPPPPFMYLTNQLLTTPRARWCCVLRPAACEHKRERQGGLQLQMNKLCGV